MQGGFFLWYDTGEKHWDRWHDIQLSWCLFDVYSLYLEPMELTKNGVTPVVSCVQVLMVWWNTFHVFVPFIVNTNSPSRVFEGISLNPLLHFEIPLVLNCNRLFRNGVYCVNFGDCPWQEIRQNAFFSFTMDHVKVTLLQTHYPTR